MSLNSRANEIEVLASRKGVRAAGDYLNVPALAKAANAPEGWVKKQVVRFADQMESRLGGDRRMQPYYPPSLVAILAEEWLLLDPTNYYTLNDLKNRVGGEGAWLRKQLQEIVAKPVIKYSTSGKELPHYDEQTAKKVLDRYYAVPATGVDRVSRAQIQAFFKLPHELTGWLADFLRSHEDQTEFRRTRRSGGSFEKHYLFTILEEVQEQISQLPEAENRLSLADICAAYPWWYTNWGEAKIAEFLAKRPTEFPAEICRYGDGLVGVFYPVQSKKILEESYSLLFGDVDEWRELREIEATLGAPTAWVVQALKPYAEHRENGFKHLRGRDSVQDRARLSVEGWYPRTVLEPLREQWQTVLKAGRWLNQHEIAAFCDAYEREIEHLLDYNEEQSEYRMGYSRWERYYPLEVAFEVRKTHLYR